jgi:hypothetical protein
MGGRKKGCSYFIKRFVRSTDSQNKMQVQGDPKKLDGLKTIFFALGCIQD